MVYQVSGNNNEFLQRTMKLRGDTVNGLSFIHSVPKTSQCKGTVALWANLDVAVKAMK